LVFSGYPEKDMPVLASLSCPGFTFLGGDGYQSEHMETNGKKDELDDDPSQQLSPHAGEDAPAYAVGLGSSSIRGTMEQNLLFDVIRSVILTN
jgi:alkaline phosphatase